MYKAKYRKYRNVIAGYRRETFTKTTSWKDTRLLLAYTCSPEAVHNYNKMIDIAVRRNDFGMYLDYLVSKIVPKEKELKVMFKGYGCLTPFARHKNVMQERNTKRFLELFSDEQAATLTELTLLK